MVKATYIYSYKGRLLTEHTKLRNKLRKKHVGAVTV